jgi:ribosomal protein L40E
LKDGSEVNAQAEEAKKRPPQSRPKVKICYKCAEYVPEDAVECPECGAGASTFNPAWIYRVVLGFFLGFMIWLIFWAA